MLVNSKCTAKTVNEFLEINNLVRTLAVRSAFYIKQTSNLLKTSDLDVKAKLNEKYALNVQRMVKCHITYVMTNFAIEYVDKYKFKDKNIRPILMLLIKVFAVKQLHSENHGLYSCGYFSSEN